MGMVFGCFSVSIVDESCSQPYTHLLYSSFATFGVGVHSYDVAPSRWGN